MKHCRRTFLHLAAGTATLPAISGLAWAQSYPARPVRIVVGFPAGGTTDIGARLIAQWLSERLGDRTRSWEDARVSHGADVEHKLEAISAKGDPLETIKKIVPWGDFRADIEAETETTPEERKSNAGPL